MAAGKKCLYKTLMVSKDADADTIKGAYRKLSMRYHPDRNIGNARAEKRFKEVQEAWDVLSDPERKARYDATGDAKTAADNQAGEVMGVLGAVLRTAIVEMDKNRLDADRTDIVAVMRKLIDANITEAQEKNVNARKFRRMLEKVAKRIRHKAGSNDMLSIAKVHMAELDQTIEVNDKTTALLKLAKEALRDYTFDIDDLLHGLVHRPKNSTGIKP